MLDVIKKKSPLLVIFLIGMLYSILVFKNPFKSVHYGDVGLMHIQIQDLIAGGYSSLTLNYRGEEIDPEYKFFPYKKPFVGKLNQNHYFVFPPYFLTINAILYETFGTNGLYLISFFAFLLTLYLIYQLGILFGLENFYINISISMYVFGMTASNYNFVFHELPFSIFWITLSIFYALSFIKRQTNLNLVLFGFLGGLSLFFRLEMIFILFACGLSILIILPKHWKEIFKFSIVGFIFPFFTLIILNYQFFENFFGLRYTLNISETPSLIGAQRLGIIYDLLFTKKIGLFYQSPFILISISFLFYFKRMNDPNKLFLILVIIVSMVSILLTSPNNGGHISPRYLFGIYPILCLISIICYKDLLKYFKNQLQQGKNNFLIRNSKLLLSLFFFLLVTFSFKSTYDNLQWIKRSSIDVDKFNQVLQSLPENIILFRDYGPPLNAQNSYFSKLLFVAEGDSYTEFFSLLKSKSQKEVAVLQLVPKEFENDYLSLNQNPDSLNEIILKYNLIPINSISKSSIKLEYRKPTAILHINLDF
ncbi:MAG: hypothetical protein IPL26_25705 [Leptospiraceae bacterium]|nr:hypothetical protein [Leptospiraceae bacterium]